MQHKFFIVGGTRAQINELPWQVLITRYGQTEGGGTIISSRWIVIAAHVAFE